MIEVDAAIETVPGARLRVAPAPLPAPEGGRLAWALEGAFGADDKPDIYVTPTAKGMDEDVARNAFAWVDVGEQVVSASWLAGPRDDPRIGTLGEVWTDDVWRERGFATRTTRALTDRFDAAGGRWLFLATDAGGNAARIYSRLGFEPHPEGLMRRELPAGSDFASEWFAPSRTTIRPIHRGDLVRIVALYAAPNPWLSMAWMQGFYSASHVTHNRCNSMVKGTWLATRAGAWLGLFNSEGALVGSAPLEPSGNERTPIDGRLDLFVHPWFVRDAGALLDAAVETATRLGWRWVTAQALPGDDEKAALLAERGFRDVARLPGAVRIGGRDLDARLTRLAL